MGSFTRRRLLRGIGASGLAVGVAGCTSPGAGGPADGIAGEEYPAVEEWLTESEIGGEAGNYDGDIEDARGEEEIEVDVGAAGNGGNLAFEPVAVAVTPGTDVRWVWTGEGGLHNVVAAPERQIGQSDYSFDSGDPVAEEGHEFVQTLGEPGVALYFCEPHLSLGMKGAVVVAEAAETTA